MSWASRTPQKKETEITLSYDEMNGFLLNALVEVPAPPLELGISDVQTLLREELQAANIISEVLESLEPVPITSQS